MTQEPVNQGHTAQPYQPVLMEEQSPALVTFTYVEHIAKPY